MTELVERAPAATGLHTSETAQKRLRARYAAERRFRWYGIIAIAVAMAMLLTLLVSIVSRGWPAFLQTYIEIDVEIDAETVFGPANYGSFAADALIDQFPDVPDDARRDLAGSLATDAGDALRDMIVADPSLLGQTVDVPVAASPFLADIRRGTLPTALSQVLDDNGYTFLGWIDGLTRGNALAATDDGAEITLQLPVPEDFDAANADAGALLLAAVGARLPQLADPGARSAAAEALLAPGAVDTLRSALDDAVPGERLPVVLPASDDVAAIADRLAAIDEPPRSLAAAKRQLETYRALQADGRIEDTADGVAVVLPVAFDESDILNSTDYQALINRQIYGLFPDADSRSERQDLRSMISPGGGFELRRLVRATPSLIGQTLSLTLPVSDEIDQLRKGAIDRTLPPERRPLTDQQLGWYDEIDSREMLTTVFNANFFTAGDSRYPELAGIWGAVVGSAYTLFVCLLLAFPIGVAAAVYLEEFAPKNRITDLIEVNINNLAAVPSIVFGLLGLAVFIQFFGLPRSAPLVGGMVLALMTLPTIIIAARAALKAVPPSIREAALGMGASRLQVVSHHVLPLAMPGILTGTIIGMAQALGETAPLLMIGMVAFITSAPDTLTSPSTVLPVQIYIWSDSPERGFAAKTSAAIMVLLAFLIVMNGLAIWLRKKFERRW